MRLEARFGDRLVPAFCERPGEHLGDDCRRRRREIPMARRWFAATRRMNWREVTQQSARIAAGFARLGLARGDRVAVLLGNRIEFALTMFAAAHAGLVTVLLSTRQQKPEIAYVLTDCGAKLLIHEATHADRMPDARDVPDLLHRISVDDGGTSQFAGLLDHRAFADARGSRRRGHRDDPLHVGHHGQAEGRDAGALQRHPFGDGVRVQHGSCTPPIARSPRCRSGMSPAWSPTS